MTAAEPLERARTLLTLNRPAEAERELRGLLAQEPENADGHAYLSVALTQQRRGPEAIDEAAEAVRLAPDQWFPHYVAGQAYYRAGRPHEAAAAAQACLALSPEHAPAWELLARVYIYIEQWPQAADAARRGLAADPEDADLAALLSLPLTMLGDAYGARQAAARALMLDPENALAHLAHGRAELVFGAPAEAARAFREVLRLAPGFDQARDLLVAALKLRNPVYRVLARLRGSFFGGWRMLFLLVVMPPIIAVFALIALLHWAAWIAEAVTTLRLARGKATRLLFEEAQARVAVVSCCLPVAGAALLVTGVATGREALGTAGAAVMALVTAVQEAAHTTARPGRVLLYGWAGLLGLAAVVSAIASWTAVALLTTYAGLATIWVAAGVRRVFRAEQAL
ncbi:MAG: tetratricopeptide repeat protein [Microbispora sp.]|nr:tetratricopeptide repeat protein [Microbispora sp.]